MKYTMNEQQTIVGIGLTYFSIFIPQLDSSDINFYGNTHQRSASRINNLYHTISRKI